MPIRGITQDLNKIRTNSDLPIIARLYKGAPKGPKRPGKDLDHFRVEFTDLAPPSLAASWQQLYGEQPTEFERVFLIGATVAEAFPTWMEEWSGSQTCQHRCDGHTQVLHFGDHGYSDEPVPCVAPACKCSKVGRLTFVLYDLTMEARVFGAVRLVTHSYHDIVNLHGLLAWVERRHGSLDGVPFVLGRADREVSTPMGDGKRALTTKSLLYLRLDEAYLHMALPQADAMALGPGGTTPQLAAGDGVLDGDWDDAPDQPLAADEVRALYAYAKGKGVTTKEDVWVALDVDDITEWLLGLPAARDYIDAYVEYLNADSDDAHPGQPALLDVPADETPVGEQMA